MYLFHYKVKKGYSVIFEGSIQFNRTLNVSEWNSMVLVFDGVYINLYLDGIYISHTILSFTPLLGSEHRGTPLWIGPNITDSTSPFRGIVSDAIVMKEVWNERDVALYHYDNLFDYNIHCSTSCEFDNLVSVDNDGYSKVDGIVTEGTLIDAPNGTGIEKSTIMFDDKVLPTGSNKDFTVSIWIKYQRNIVQNQPIFDTGAVQQGNGYGIYIHKSEDSFRFKKDSFQFAMATEKAVTDQWYHVVITSEYSDTEDTTKLRGYLDGTVRREYASADWNNTTEYPLALIAGNSWVDDGSGGSTFGSWAYRFKGGLAKFKIFDKALTPLQVENIYQADLTERIHYDVIKDPTEWPA